MFFQVPTCSGNHGHMENHQKSSMHGKIMEFGKKTLNNRGKIMEFVK